MQRVCLNIPINNPKALKEQLFQWSRNANEIVWLDSNSYPQQTHASYEAVLAVKAHTQLRISYHQAFDHLERYQAEVQDWIFGYLSYDLKNTVENLHSHNHDELAFPDLYFFQPQKLFLLHNNHLEILYLM